ncbi:UDP-N-acetylglucosamine 2-epimerase [Niastella koreensis]|uniref:UDP-N-acetylglucosamine 2-epimerase n=2 Tax=Niastella koreensis TaxID=354356 RepID=G8TLC0_NIAKG|nr:UDP-N-acetylglucosamine 2-epimerase (non-hydrolyzing) [Niastella koreensis]AEW02993.1 UDP-N-acetylglucosamine 2-epimerase [Niastella koreensis GR20-10]OQP55308.1 UDP-N-acetylglucosamine 2-epimerase [Niastella koreensis]
MKKILLVAGTRPNFIKLAPLYHRIISEATEYRPYICHTGQHFDFNMSDVFWQNLELPAPDFQLGVKGSGVADTIGKTILGINEVVQQHKFDLVIVFGDVNATAAGAIVGAQSRVPVMHVEAGLRSFDRDMPEEINRIITDHVSDYLMVSEPSGIKNLQREGFAENKVIMVGNIMIECLLRTRQLWEHISLPHAIDAVYKNHPVVATFHRPENVDNKDNLNRVAEILTSFAATETVIFPVHPRTRAKLQESGLLEKLQKESNLLLTEPLSYFEFLKLVSNAKMVITDSGGVQEETSFLNIPCITFRKNTERPVTVELGTNLMMDLWNKTYSTQIEQHRNHIMGRERVSIPLWDEEVSKRIVNTIKRVI